MYTFSAVALPQTKIERNPSYQVINEHFEASGKNLDIVWPMKSRVIDLGVKQGSKSLCRHIFRGPNHTEPLRTGNRNLHQNCVHIRKLVIFPFNLIPQTIEKLKTGLRGERKESIPLKSGALHSSLLKNGSAIGGLVPTAGWTSRKWWRP